MARVLLIGNGLIGSATADALEAWGHVVKRYDKDSARSHISREEAEASMRNMDYVVSVVNTEPTKDGFDMSMVKKNAEWFAQHGNVRSIFIQRSTSYPGDARQVSKEAGLEGRYVMWPSFAYRNAARENETTPVKVVLGGGSLGLCTWVLNDLFSKVRDKVFLGTLEEAEMSKIASNLFQSLILSAWNTLKYQVESADSDFVMETLIQEANMASLKRFHGKAWGQNGRLDSDLRAFVGRTGPHTVFGEALHFNDNLRDHVGEENRQTSELKKLGFSGRVSPGLKK